MRTAPTGWEALFEAPHKTVYKFEINSVEYGPSDYMGVPVIIRPLMDQPVFGRCCTGSLQINIRKKTNVTIPKAASVVAYCRLEDGTSQSGWLELGHYWISKRVDRGTVLELTCNDGMTFASQEYNPLTAIQNWPAKMTTVLADIASIMNVTVDSRTTIIDSTSYAIDYPNEDVLISEVLAEIAAAHGGSFVMTEEGKLRLIPFPTNSNISVYFYDSALFDTATFVSNGVDINKAYIDFKQISNGLKTISRITMTDSAGDQYTYGTDTGVEIMANYANATQAIVNAVGATVVGCQFIPYDLKGAYFNPLIELGDAFTVTANNTSLVLIACYIKVSCTTGFFCDVSNHMDEDDEEETPYVSRQEMAARRYVSTDKSYRGNRVNRTEGFVSEYIVNGSPVARLTANSDTFKMERLDPDTNQWNDCIYFDAVNRKYVISGDVSITSNDFYGKVSGITIDSSGVAITGNKYVSVASSGGGTWYFNQNGFTLLSAYSSSYAIQVSEFSIGDTLYCNAGIFADKSVYSTNGSLIFLTTDLVNHYYSPLYMETKTDSGGTASVFRPYTDLYGDLGDTSHSWWRMYINRIYGISDRGIYIHPEVTKSHYIHLDFSGSDIHFFASSAGNVVYHGTIVALSSKEVKHDIVDIPDTSQIIDNLRPVSFIYNNDTDSRKHYGLIYEEVCNVVPEMCIEGFNSCNNQAEKNLNYLELVPLLLKEIQNLRERVKELENWRVE